MNMLCMQSKRQVRIDGADELWASGLKVQWLAGPLRAASRSYAIPKPPTTLVTTRV